MEKFILKKDINMLIDENGITKVFSNKIKTIIEEKCVNILKNSCNYYGNSLKSALRFSKETLLVKYKVPIKVSNNIYLFPLNSTKNDKCIWLNAKNIENYYKNSFEKIVVIFKSGDSIILDCSKTIFENQLFRTNRLENIVNQRLSE